MTMLPTPRLGAVISGHGDGATSLSVLEALLDGRANDITWTAALGAGVIACDVVVGVVDADEGLSAGFIDRWALARDAQVPRVLLVTHCVAGRADFGEVVAIVERALGEDPVVRFLPLASDDGMSVAAVLDVLDGRILLADGGTAPAEPEHLDLTAESRDDLVRVLAHEILDDDRLDQFLRGSPISLPAVRQGWDHALAGPDPLVPVLPGDALVMGSILISLLNAVAPRLHVIVEDEHGIADVYGIGACVGIGIQHRYARIWNCDGETVCELLDSDLEVVGTIATRGVLACDERITVDATLRPPGSSLVVRPPRF